VKTWLVRHRLTGHRNNVSSCDFSPDGALLATASYDSRVIIWDTDSGTSLFFLELVVSRVPAFCNCKVIVKQYSIRLFSLLYTHEADLVHTCPAEYCSCSSPRSLTHFFREMVYTVTQGMWSCIAWHLFHSDTFIHRSMTICNVQLCLAVAAVLKIIQIRNIEKLLRATAFCNFYASADYAVPGHYGDVKQVMNEFTDSLRRLKWMWLRTNFALT